MEARHRDTAKIDRMVQTTSTVESMRYFHNIHDIIPLPVDGTTTVREMCLEHNHMDTEQFFQQLQHTQEDGNAIMIGETL